MTTDQPDTTAVASLADLTTLSPLASGRNSVLHLVANAVPGNSGALVYKQYVRPPDAPTTQVLRSIVRLRGTVPEPHRAALDELTVWPLAVVVDADGGATGVLMRRIPATFAQEIDLPSGTTATIPREVQHLIYEPAAAHARGVDAPATDDGTTRLRLCERLAHILSVLHTNGIVFGDISARNVLYTLRPAPSVLLVDCDGVRPIGTDRAQADTPDWHAPEMGTAQGQTLFTDRYKLALFVLRCLAPGRFSSVNRRVASAEGRLDATGMDLLARGLDGPPAARPTAEEWCSYLRRHS